MKSELIECANGDKYWHYKGKWHREDGPAIELANGDKHWYKEGRLHREDGPAIEYAYGVKEWYCEGKKINCNTQHVFKRLLKLKVFW